MKAASFSGVLTLFIRLHEGSYTSRRLTGVFLTAETGISGGELLPKRSAVMYYSDYRSRCFDRNGASCEYITPDKWDRLSNRDGFFTFNSDGGGWLALGDMTVLSEPPYDSAFRITSVLRPGGGRRHLRHYKISCG